MIASQATTGKVVEGDLGVWFVYTAGLAGEDFLKGLQSGKILASTCGGCKRTYCPPRIFCEDCFSEITDRHEVRGAGTVVTLAQIGLDADGKRRAPEWAGAIRLDGTDTAILHRLNGAGLKIGDRVEAVWEPERKGSILDIQHFARSSSKPGARRT